MHTTEIKKQNYDEEMAPNRKTALGANLVLAKKNTLVTEQKWSLWA